MTGPRGVRFRCGADVFISYAQRDNQDAFFRRRDEGQMKTDVAQFGKLSASEGSDGRVSKASSGGRLHAPGRSRAASVRRGPSTRLSTLESGRPAASSSVHHESGRSKAIAPR